MVTENVKKVRKLLLKAIKEKSKEPLRECEKVVKNLTMDEYKKILIDTEVNKMLTVLDRNILTEIDEQHIPFGPPVENPYE